MRRASEYQAREFPRYRAGFAKQAYGALWENDIIVSARGDGNATLRLRGYAFATNRNIADMHAGLVEAASRVRFKRVEYQALEGGSVTWFDLETPADSEVGVWVGREFMSASRPGSDEEVMLAPRS